MTSEQIVKMRDASEALKGIKHACDITHAEPEFIEFIRQCNPASVLAMIEQLAALREAAQAALSLLENIGTGKWAKTPAGDLLRAALNPERKEGEKS